MARSSCRVAFVVWQQLQKRWKSTYSFLRLQSSRLPAQSLIFGCQHWQTQGQSRAVNDVREDYAFTIKISETRPSGPLRLNTAANDLILGPMWFDCLHAPPSKLSTIDWLFKWSSRLGVCAKPWKTIRDWRNSVKIFCVIFSYDGSNVSGTDLMFLSSWCWFAQ